MQRMLSSCVKIEIPSSVKMAQVEEESASEDDAPDAPVVSVVSDATNATVVSDATNATEATDATEAKVKKASTKRRRAVEAKDGEPAPKRVRKSTGARRTGKRGQSRPFAKLEQEVLASRMDKLHKRIQRSKGIHEKAQAFYDKYDRECAMRKLDPFVDAVAPVAPVAPVESDAPVAPVAPVESDAPVAPVAPVESDAPVEPVAPVQPVESDACVQPAKPAKPAVDV
jgi:hypothetical protein